MLFYTPVISHAYMCALVLFMNICVLAGINVNPSVYLIGGCGALFPEPCVLDGRCARCCIHTHNASYKSIMEGKTMAREVISVQPHPPGSNCTARHVKENQRLCKVTHSLVSWHNLLTNISNIFLVHHTKTKQNKQTKKQTNLDPHPEMIIWGISVAFRKLTTYQQHFISYGLWVNNC